MSATDSAGLASQLRESEARAAALHDSAIDGIVTMDGDGRLVDLNDAAAAMFGLSLPEVRGEPVGDLIIPPESRGAHRDGLARVVAGGQSRIAGQRVELEAMRSDGSRFPVELSIARVDTAAGLLFVGYVRDISTRKASEQLLREQYELAAFGRDVALAITRSAALEEILRACTERIVEHLGAAFARIWTVEDDGSLLVLRASSGLYTHTDGQHSRIPMGQLKIGHIAAEQQPHLTNAVVGDPRVHDQEWAREAGMVAFAGYPLVVEGRTVGVMAMFARHALSDSAVEGMASVASSIAIAIERKRMEGDLQHYADELLRADERKNEFLAMLGHELRNPLAPLRSAFDLVRIGRADESTLGIMDKQLGHMSRLVDDLLDIARVVRGQLKLERRRAMLESVLRASIESVRPLLGSRRLTLDVRDSDVLTVSVDEMRMEQVFNNLLHNAIKYSSEGTEIRLEASARDGRAHVLIADEGIGIDAEFLPQVFALFAQADRSLDRSRGGLGLGLALSRRIVEQHGGVIEAHSEGEGLGSTFTIELPLEESAPMPEDEVRTQAEKQGVGRRVLVVDDNVDAAVGIGRLIRAVGPHDVAVVHDGPAALAQAESFGPDLVLLDIGLPGMDGLEVARRLRELDALRAALIVALTGYGGADDKQRALEAGCDLHRVKPLDLDGLQALLERRRGD